MKKNLFVIIATLCFMFIPQVVSAENPSFWIYDTTNTTELTTNIPFQVSVGGIPTEPIKWVSLDEKVCTVDNNGLITPVSDGSCIITATAGNDSGFKAFVINAFGKLQKEVNDYLNVIPDTINLDVIEDIEVVNDEIFEFDIQYSYDYLYNYIYENYTSVLGNDVNISFDKIENSNKYKFDIVKYFYYDTNDSQYYVGGVNSTINKEVVVNFATGNEKDKKEVIKEVNKTKDIYNVYINDMIVNQSTFSDNILFKNAEIHKEIGKDIELKFDARAGDDTPGQAAALGFVSFGKNGVFYATKNIEFYQVLKTPALKGDKVKALKEYIDKNLLKDNQEADVEETEYDRDGKPVYKITIKSKENNSLISMLLSPFIMKVKADDSNVIYTTIEEDTSINSSSNNVSSPGTGDLGLTYILLLLISSVSVVVLSKKVRHN